MSAVRGMLGKLDWVLILVYMALVALGLINIYAADYNKAYPELINLKTNYGKQFIWVLVSLAIALVILIIDARLYIYFANPAYIASMILLVFTIFFAKEVAGSKSWFEIGFIRIQTSEFAKFTTALVLAKLISKHDFDMFRLQDRLSALGLVFLPIILINLQNDFGSSLVFFSFFILLYRAGLPTVFIIIPIWLGVVFLVGLLFDSYWVTAVMFVLAVVVFYFIRRNGKAIALLIGIFLVSVGNVFLVDYAFDNILKPHQQQRVNVLLSRDVDLQGAGYNLHQSLIAIGSGGLQGKGFMNGTQTKFNFVPEQSTDFIFCTIGEEYGWFGSAVLITLFLILFIRLIFSAERQRSLFNKCYAYGVLGVLFFHFMVNLGMTIGLFPVVGIPLPFLSYGGSSLMSFTILLFIYIKLDASHRHFYLE